ncbi:MAG: hypothetical protein E7599_03570 [Ruminococcaceae bacterium]|nr:hypothetical protein [Oscillospiraceae bacterium]
MKKNELKDIDGKKIRRQYFNAPLIFLLSFMIAIPYSITVFSLAMGKYEQYALPSTLKSTVLVCGILSLPFWILRALNKRFFGKIICVLNEEGIHHPKGMLKWDAIEKIEYALDAKPRYKSDPSSAFRAIVYYAQGTKHLVLEKAPISILSRIKKYRKDVDARIEGGASFLPTVLILSAIVIICPLYILSLKNAPGATTSQVIVFMAIWLVLGIARIPVFDAFLVEYRFWSKILHRKWLSYIVLACYYPLFFVALLVLFHFPNWFVVVVLGMCVGIIQPPVPSRYGSARLRRILSYEQLYDIYINKADFWESQIKQRKNNGRK